MNYIDPLYDWEGYEFTKIVDEPVVLSPSQLPPYRPAFQQSEEVLAPAVETEEERNERLMELVRQFGRS